MPAEAQLQFAVACACCVTTQFYRGGTCSGGVGFGDFSASLTELWQWDNSDYSPVVFTWTLTFARDQLFSRTLMHWPSAGAAVL